MKEFRIDIGWKLLAVALVVALVAGLVGCGELVQKAELEEEPVSRAYQTGWYVTDGGDKAIVASGGELEIQSGGTIDIQDGSTVTFDGGMDLNGSTLTVDADGDTTMVASDDDVVSMTVGAATGYFDVLTGNLKVGDGTPDTSQDGEDAYVEGTLEVDGAANFDSTMDVAGNISDSDSAVTIADNAMIDGAADAVQLTVQSHGTQTNNTFVVEQSDGTDLFWVDNNGDAELNGATPQLTIGDAGEEDTAIVFDGAEQDFYVALDDTANDLLLGLGSAVGTTPGLGIDENLAIATYGDITMNGATPVLTVGDAGEEDTAVVFDGAAQDFYAGIYDTDDDLQIGLGSALGTTPIIVLDENQEMGIGGASAGAKLDVTGNVMVDGGADEEQLVVQGHSTQGNSLLVLEDSSGNDVFGFALAPAAAGSGDLLDVTDSFVAQDGEDHLIGIDVNLTGGDHSGADNTLVGIDLDLTTEDAQCTETAIDVTDTSWDIAIDAADVPIVSTAAEWMEDFWGDTIHDELVNVEGTDPQVVALALAQEQYGVGTMVSGDDNAGGCAASCAGMSVGRHWSASQGGLMFETRLHLDTSIADTVICAGLSDSLALVMPATISGASYTTNAADGVFFCYDTAADTDEWHAIAVDTNVDATGIGATGEAPAFDTYQVLRIEVDAGGADAKFYIDGALVKTLTANVVTPATLLSPVIVIDTNADASKTVDIDYVYVTARR